MLVNIYGKITWNEFHSMDMSRKTVMMPSCSRQTKLKSIISHFLVTAEEDSMSFPSFPEDNAQQRGQQFLISCLIHFSSICKMTLMFKNETLIYKHFIITQLGYF